MVTERSGATGRPRLLLVEDEPTNLKMMVALLGRAGFACETARDGEEALARVADAGPFDAVLMDLQMPRLDGFAAARALREQEAGGGGRRLPIFAITAHSLADAQSRAQEVDMDGLLTKPLRIPVLLRTLAEAGVAVPAAPQGEAAEQARGARALDPATIARLQRLQSPERPSFLRDLAATFERSSAEQMVSLRAALEQDDGAAVREAAHALKGASQSVGAHRLSGLCADLEQLARGGAAAATMSHYLRDLERELAQALHALRELS
jgi:CheY-like chemotaxis protein